MRERCENNVIERPSGRSKVFALRFQAYGRRRYLTLGAPEDGWTRRRAEEEMEAIRREVQRGSWVPPSRPRVAFDDRGDVDGPLFGSFAVTQVRERRDEVRPATSEYREWALGHLLPFFADRPLKGIDARSVDAYRIGKLEESEDCRRRLGEGRPRTDALGRALRPLSASSINKTIEVLRWLLAFAVEYGWIDDNPAVGRRRRIKVDRSSAPHLESAAQIATVLEVAASLDADPGWLIDDRLPVIATLLFAGLRVHELAGLRWGDLDFAAQMIRVRDSKTPAGIREVELLPALRGHLLGYRGRRDDTGARELVFRTTRGGVRTKDNVRLRVLAPVLVRTAELLDERDLASLPPGITPHSMRHTFASLLFALGEDPVFVMRQLGHSDSAFTLGAYAHSMSRKREEREWLRDLVAGEIRTDKKISTDIRRKRRNPACGAEWTTSNSNHGPPGPRPGGRPRL